MSTYQTKLGLGDEVWYIGPDYRAKKGKITQVLVQESYPEPTSPKNFPLTYIQYRVDDQYMSEDRVFASHDALIQHVSDASK